MFENMLKGIEIRVNTDYFANKECFDRLAKKIVFTGKIDEFYDYKFGELEYRALRFENELLPMKNYQGNAVINYTSADIPWTRIIEHKYFDEASAEENVTIITKEIPDAWAREKIPYYPVGDEGNRHIFEKYNNLAKNDERIVFGGRLAEYRYYDMHQVIRSAFTKFGIEFKNNI